MDTSIIYIVYPAENDSLAAIHSIYDTLAKAEDFVNQQEPDAFKIIKKLIHHDWFVKPFYRFF